MKSNAPNEFLGKAITKTTRVMRKIELTTSKDSTTITPEKIGANIEQMVHEFATIC